MTDEPGICLLEPFKSRVHTRAPANGKEFAGHSCFALTEFAGRAIIADQLDAKFYFAHAYASWERGANENTNGLVRQCFPKKQRFHTIIQKDIDFIMRRLNHRPRQCLGFRTPHEVFMKSLQRVALQG